MPSRLTVSLLVIQILFGVCVGAWIGWANMHECDWGYGNSPFAGAPAPCAFERILIGAQVMGYALAAFAFLCAMQGIVFLGRPHSKILVPLLAVTSIAILAFASAIAMVIAKQWTIESNEILVQNGVLAVGFALMALGVVLSVIVLFEALPSALRSAKAHLPPIRATHVVVGLLLIAVIAFAPYGVSEALRGMRTERIATHTNPMQRDDGYVQPATDSASSATPLPACDTIDIDPTFRFGNLKLVSEEPRDNGSCIGFMRTYETTNGSRLVYSCPIIESGYEAWEFTRKERAFSMKGITYHASLWLGTPLPGSEELESVNLLLVRRNGFENWSPDPHYDDSCEIVDWRGKHAEDLEWMLNLL